jgi:hypothetical protein
MAHMNQEKKAKIADAIKPILKKYGIKGSLSVNHHSTVVLTLKSGKIDFVANMNRVCGSSHYQTSRGFKPSNKGYIQVNPYWVQEHYDGDALEFLTLAIKALKSAGWYNNSDAQIDYFDTAYYIDINVGRWNKDYAVTE